MNNTSRRPMPVFFALLCLLSLISSAFAVIYGFSLPSLASVDRQQIVDIFAQSGVEATDEIIAMFYSLASMGLYYALFNVVEIVALLMLLLGHRMGTHCYAASQLGLVGVMIIAVGVTGSFSYIVWCALWTVLYFRLSQRHFGSVSSDT